MSTKHEQDGLCSWLNLHDRGCCSLFIVQGYTLILICGVLLALVQKAAHLCRNFHHSVGPRLPSNDCHLLLDGLHVWRLIWLSPVCESHDSLGVLALLLCPVLQEPALFESALLCSCPSSEDSDWDAERPGCVSLESVGLAGLLTCCSKITYLYSIFERAGSSNCTQLVHQVKSGSRSARLQLKGS